MYSTASGAVKEKDRWCSRAQFAMFLRTVRWKNAVYSVSKVMEEIVSSKTRKGEII